MCPVNLVTGHKRHPPPYTPLQGRNGVGQGDEKLPSLNLGFASLKIDVGFKKLRTS